MNTKLNKSDYILIVIIYAITIIFSSFDYYKEGNFLKEYFIDFSASIIMSLSVVLLFMYWWKQIVNFRMIKVTIFYNERHVLRWVQSVHKKDMIV